MLRNWSLNPLAKVAIGILRSYGADAHVYIPGVGTVSGITAGNYLDSAGTTIASVDNPVGLSLDALQAMTLGSNLAVNGTFSADANWNKDANWTIAGGVATSNGGTGFLQANIPPLTAGKTYFVTVSIKRYVSGGIYYPYSGSGGVAAPTSVGTFTSVHLATSNNLYVYSLSFNGDIDDVIVKEIPGIHATQGTTANKAILRQSGGKYSWQFDGSNDSLSLSAPLFQMSDDHAVIAGVNQTIAANGYVFSQNNTAATTLVGAIAVTSGGFARALWADNSGASAFITGSTPITGVTKVITAIKQGNAKKLRVNGVQDGSTNNTVMGTTTLNTASIGSFTTSGNLTGSIYPVIAIKGTLSDSDLLVMERFVGQLSGVTGI